MVSGIIFNIGGVFYYKYYNFVIENFNYILGTSFGTKDLLLPLGISFFVFKSISLLIDVYCGKVVLGKNPVNSALYLSFFAQITSGPICRYNEFYAGNTNFARGGYYFVLGFVKKVLLANILSIITVEVFGMDLSKTTPAFLWLGAICYSLQLYYDFAGYSDMAVGLGEMCGISCCENFNYPYMTSSVSGFWRSWHISLGSWFRDYVYIPLGGSRTKTKGRTYLNLFIVWFLTGIWHGANWTFIFWGISYFVVISFEKIFDLPKRFHSKIGKAAYRVFTLMFINLQWVIFNSTDLRSGLRYIKGMFVFSGDELANHRAVILLREYGIFIAAALIFATPIVPKLKLWISGNEIRKQVGNVVFAGMLCFLFLWAVSFVIAGQNNPFLYGNF